MLPIHTAPVSVASETASRGQILARRTQTSAWVSFLESGRVVLGVMRGGDFDPGELLGGGAVFVHVALGRHGVLVERDRVVRQFKGHVRRVGAEVTRHGAA